MGRVKMGDVLREFAQSHRLKSGRFNFLQSIQFIIPVASDDSSHLTGARKTEKQCLLQSLLPSSGPSGLSIRRIFFGLSLPSATISVDYYI
jgi:hypothetical protein